MRLLDFLFRRKPQQRSYAGASTSRLFSDFRGSQRSADSEIRPALRTLRNRTRDLSRNNEYVKRYLSLLKTNVIGDKGIRLQVKARNDSGQFDRVGNDIIEAAWDRWCENCSVDGKTTFLDAQRLAVECLARDGEVIIRKVRGYTNPSQFAIQFLEPDMLDDQKNELSKTGNRIRMGVEIDEYRKPMAYWMFTQHPGDSDYISVAASSTHQRIESERIIHLFMPDRAQQTRGVPWLSPAISSLKMLHAYREAELVAARVGAAKMGFFTSPAGDGYQADEIDQNVPIMEADPGTFVQLPKGVEFESFSPDHPNSGFEQFEKAVLRGIASGLGVSYYALANDLTAVSYSSIRAGELADRDFYKTIQQFMIQHFVKPIFQEWLVMAMTSGEVNLPIFRYEKFRNAAHFRPRGFAWVDPQREIAAHVMALNNGLVSMQDVEANYGRDIDEVFEQISLEKELAANYGLSMAFEPFGQKQQAAPIITGSE